MSKPSPNDIRKAKKGHKGSIRLIYDHYENTWFRIALRYANNNANAEDIFQEGVTRIFKDLNGFDPSRGAFKNWSSRVLINSALRYLKNQQWNNSFEGLDHVDYSDQRVNIIDQMSAKEIIELIQKLPPGYRIIFNLFVLDEFTHQEIAEKLNIAVGTSKSQLSKARKILRSELEILFNQ